MSSCEAAIFDLSTLAFVQLTADAQGIRTFRPYPGAVAILTNLHANGVRLGVRFSCAMVPEEDLRALLASHGLGELATGMMVVPSGALLLNELEAAAAEIRREKGCLMAKLLYVGGDPVELDLARQAGFRPVPHPELAARALNGGGRLQYVRINVPAGLERSKWIPALREHSVIPLHIGANFSGSDLVSLYAITDTRAAAALDDLGFRVDRLGAPGAPSRSTLYLVQDDLQERTGFLRPAGNASKLFAKGPAASQLLASTDEGLLVALRPDTPLESLNFADSQDSHARRLSPSLHFLETTSRVTPRDRTLVEAAIRNPLSSDELKILHDHFDPRTMKDTVGRYMEAGKHKTGGPYGSRFLKHDGNKIAVDMLVTELRTLESEHFSVQRHCYNDNGVKADNVIATLRVSQATDHGIVILGCHLDTISKSGNDDADQSPGADDDASGMAAVLAIARAFVELSRGGTGYREVRFAFFNGEELGMTGSQVYADAQAAGSVKVTAMFQLDMIGYNHNGKGIIEAHAGLSVAGKPNEAAVERSLDQAKLLEHLLPISPKLKDIEIFPHPDDPGARRSDHHRFHIAGYPGCWVTENFFPEKVDSDPLNPAYHSANDTNIDEHYVADIARLVAAAAWIAATR